MKTPQHSMRKQTCCFTGHREIPIQDRGMLARRLEDTVRALIRSGVRYFGAGGARGFDTLAAETVLRLRKEYPHIRLILVLPCLSQTRGWREEEKRRYEAIKTAADKVRYISREYTPECMHRRNRHLVEYSGVCVCYLTHGGGTGYTVDYARRNHVPVINLAAEQKESSKETGWGDL